LPDWTKEPKLELGTSVSTAFRGDYGQFAYEHANDSNKINIAMTSKLYKIASTSDGHIASLIPV
jgi:hypothetical protein